MDIPTLMNGEKMKINKKIKDQSIISECKEKIKFYDTILKYYLPLLIIAIFL